MKTSIEKILFFILNIIFSFWHLQLAVLFVLICIILLILPRFKNPDDDILCFFWVPIIIAPFIWLIKLNMFKLIYKITKTGFVHNFLNSFLTDKVFKIKVLISALLIDITNVVMLEIYPLIDKSVNFAIVILVLFIILGGNLTTSYLAFSFCKPDNISKSLKPES